MATLAELKSRVRRAIGKGTSVDDDITDAIRAAARKIEQNRTYQYMKKFGTFTFDLESDDPRVIDTPNEFKRIKLVRIAADADGDGTTEYYRVKRGLDHEETALEEGMPTRYELDGVSRLIFNKIPDEEWTVHVFFDQYTSWPTEDSATNWLLKNGEDALFYEAMMGLAHILRDSRQRQSLQGMRDEAYRSLLIADEEMADSDYASAMLFTPEGGIDLD